MRRNVIRSKREAHINNIYEVGKYFRDKNSLPITITSQLMIFNPLALELDIYSLAHHLCKM